MSPPSGNHHLGSGECAGILCKSKMHGDQLNATLTKRAPTSKQFCGYLMWLCGNCACAVDSVGRTTLHLAASRGLKDVVKWMVHCKHANIDAKDRESGYTALHRSIFYGQIQIAVYLIKNGANIQLFDRDYLTPIDHAMKDRPSLVSYCLSNNCEVYMWGTNSNYTLGLQQTKPYPELLGKQNLDVPIKQVCLRKFHCVMISKDGRAFSCGHGQGGRLGLGETNTAMKPTPISFQSRSQDSHVCEQTAIGYDHSMFLMDSSTIWTCGLNTYHVLGFNPPPEMLLKPKPLPEFKTPITGISAGRFHSVAWGPSTVYTWGLNAGQLGHESTLGKTIILPKQVTTLRGANFLITNVAASDGATVVVVQRGDIYVLHEYQCRKIASRQLNVAKVAVIGGHLNEKLDPGLSHESTPLKVLVITNKGNVLLWQESSLQLTRCIFNINRAMIIRDAVLNKSNVLFVTNDGEAFQGVIKERKIKTTSNSEKLSKKNLSSSQFNKFLDKNECELIILTRLRNIHRAVSISSDTKGRNFCVLQNDPKIHLKLPSLNQTTIHDDFRNLLKSTDEIDPIADVCFLVESKQFFAHRYIVSSASKILHSKIENNLNSTNIEIENISAKIFTELLEFIYTKTCKLLNNYEHNNSIVMEDNFQKSSFNLSNKIKHDEKKTLNPIRALQSAAKQLGVIDLYRYIESLTQNKRSSITVDLSLKFDRFALVEMYDVKVKCSNGQHIQAHKCILAGRLDYFNNLFAIRWNGDAKRIIVGLPFPYKIVTIVIDFLYTDNVNIDNEDIDLICNVLVLADQLFITRLKQICEITLVKKLTFRNIAPLLQFAQMYCGDNLKKSCIEFICLNLSAVLENRTLEVLDDDILIDISRYYWENNSKLHARVITPYSDAPSDDVVTSVCDQYPIDIEHIDEDIDKQLLKLAQKRKLLRTHKSSQTEKSKIRNDSVCSNISENEINDSNQYFNDSNISSIDLNLSRENLFTLDNLIENEIPKSDWITVNSSHQKLVQARLRANAQMKQESDLEISENFTKLTSQMCSTPSPYDSPFGSPEQIVNNFPELNSPKTRDNYMELAKLLPSSHVKYDPSKHKIQKLSQKQRKKLQVEQQHSHTEINFEKTNSENLSNVTENISKQNPWKKIDLIQERKDLDEGAICFPDIVAHEQKKKENLTKMKAKPLLLTQIEDRAIQEIGRFYNIDTVSEEYLTVKRVDLTQNIAAPQWLASKVKKI